MPRPRPRPTDAKSPLPVDQGGLGLVVSDSPNHGILILNVNRDTPAWTEGIQTGDYLLELAGKDIVTPTDFLTVVRSHPPRESVSLVVWRKGKPLKGDVILTTAEAADDRVAEDGRALIIAETHGDDTVVIKRTPDRSENLDREPEQPTVVLDKEPDGTAVVIDRARVEPIPTDYEELAQKYRQLQLRIQQLEEQVNNRPKN
jgi:C-terminal processing protease CtpA/Prc